jgi:hypothetical protein
LISFLFFQSILFNLFNIVILKDWNLIWSFKIFQIISMNFLTVLEVKLLLLIISFNILIIFNLMKLLKKILVFFKIDTLKFSVHILLFWLLIFHSLNNYLIDLERFYNRKAHKSVKIKIHIMIKVILLILALY